MLGFLSRVETRTYYALQDDPTHALEGSLCTPIGGNMPDRQPIFKPGTNNTVRLWLWDNSKPEGQNNCFEGTVVYDADATHTFCYPGGGPCN
jgi:hypothetical protein